MSNSHQYPCKRGASQDNLMNNNDANRLSRQQIIGAVG
jgi:hypothetical protein